VSSIGLWRSRSHASIGWLSAVRTGAAHPSTVCPGVGYAANAAAMGIELDDLRFELSGEVDLRGFLGISEDVRAGYESVTVTTYVEADAPAAELETLRDRVEATSPLVDSVANEVPVETDLVVAEP